MENITSLQQDYRLLRPSLAEIVSLPPGTKIDRTVISEARERVRAKAREVMLQEGVDIGQRVTSAVEMIRRVSERDGMPLARAYFFYTQCSSEDWPVHLDVREALGFSAEDVGRAIDEIGREQGAQIFTPASCGSNDLYGPSRDWINEICNRSDE